MLFFGFFWAFFHIGFSPPVNFGFIYPPLAVKAPELSLPFFNTVLLLLSGMFVTLVHKNICLGNFKETIDNLIITISLGFLFIGLQGMEYYKTSFNFFDSVYACSFYMLTGLHGMHVLVGATFLFFCLLRAFRRHFLTSHYLGLVMAIWY